METTLSVDWTTQPVPKTKAEFQEAITQMFTEMERANARMDQSRVEIDRLAEQTRATLANISRLMTV